MHFGMDSSNTYAHVRVPPLPGTSGTLPTKVCGVRSALIQNLRGHIRMARMEAWRRRINRRTSTASFSMASAISSVKWILKRPNHRLYGHILPQKACCQSLQNLMKCPPLAWLPFLWHNMQTMLARGVRGDQCQTCGGGGVYRIGFCSSFGKCSTHFLHKGEKRSMSGIHFTNQCLGQQTE